MQNLQARDHTATFSFSICAKKSATKFVPNMENSPLTKNYY